VELQIIISKTIFRLFIKIVLLKDVINHIGEGCKPIFDREEIKMAIVKTNEVEERHTVVTVDKDQSGMHYVNNYLCLLFIKYIL